MKRIAYSGFGLVLSFGLLAPGAGAQSQTQPNSPSQTSQGSSLGDYARQVRKDTQPKAKPKVFDNDNLPTEDKLSIVGPATPTPPPAENASEAKPGEEAAKAAQPRGAAPATEAKAPAPSTSPKPADEEVPFRLIRAREVRVVGFRQVQRGHGGDLKRMGRADRQEVVGPPHRAREGLRPDRPADPPPRCAVGLREAVDCDRPLGHLADRRERYVTRPIEDDVLVDFVRHRDDVVVRAQVRDRPEFVPREDLARRVVRRVQDEDLRPVRERGFQRFLVHGPVGPRHPHVPRAGAAHDRVRTVVLVEGLEDDRLVALVDQGEHRGHHPLGRAARDDQVRLRVRVDPVERLRPPRDRVAELAGAPRDRVLIVSAVEGPLRRGGEFRRRLEVRIPLGQVHGAVQHGDPRHLSDDRLREFLDSVRDASIADRDVLADGGGRRWDGGPPPRKVGACKNLSGED